MEKTKKVLITGASGLIGTRLTQLLVYKGYNVSHLVRSKNKTQVKSFLWDIDTQFIEPDAFKDVNTIIHLAGAGIADKRWTSERKKEILDSRINSTELLFKELQTRTHAVKNFISASAIGYYGFEDNEKLFNENDKPGKDYLANVVEAWENAIDKLIDLNLRVVKIRIGIVLSTQGGALQEMAKPVKWLAGAPLGTGKQNVSWIHIDDLCNMFIHALENESMRGAYNGSGPYAVTNAELTTAIGNVMNKPVFLPAVPAFVLKTLLGEMADLVLKGSKVSSDKIQQSGFKFQFERLEKAISDLFLRKV